MVVIITFDVTGQPEQIQGTAVADTSWGKPWIWGDDRSALGYRN